MKKYVIGLMVFIGLVISANAQIINNRKSVEKLLDFGSEIMETKVNVEYCHQALKYYDAALLVDPNNMDALVLGDKACRKTIYYSRESKVDLDKLFFFYVKSYYYVSNLINILEKRPSKKFTKDEIKRLYRGESAKTLDKFKIILLGRDDDILHFFEDYEYPSNGVEFAFFNCKKSKYYPEIKNAYLSKTYEDLINNPSATLNDYDQFLIANPDYVNYQKLVRLRDSVAVINLLESDDLSVSDVETFITRHPNLQNELLVNNRFTTLLDSLIFFRDGLAYSALNNKSYSECVGFLNNYPNSRYESKLVIDCQKNRFLLAADTGTSASYQRYIDLYPNSNFIVEAKNKRNDRLYVEAMKMNDDVKGEKLNELVSNVYGVSSWKNLYRKAINSRDSLAVNNMYSSGANYEQYNEFISMFPNSAFTQKAITLRNENAIEYANFTYANNLKKFNLFLLQSVGMPIYVVNTENDSVYQNLERIRLQIAINECNNVSSEKDKIKYYRMFLYLFRDSAPKDLIDKAENFLLSKGKDPYGTN